jgi:LacI family transcriptional regulator, repressor for deo operon, udp, cdd, tsx, nupC, and nupG
MPERVSDPTRSRVMEAVVKMGYLPNSAARSLRSHKTRMVLVVLPDLGNIFFSKILRGIEEELFSAGYGMIIGNLDGSPEKEERFATFAATGQVDGVLLLNGHLFRRSGGTRRTSIKASVPLVALCEAIEGADIPQIEVDNRTAAQRMTRYLASLGHRHIGYVCGPAGNVLEKERFRGYRDALEEVGAPFEASRVWPGDYTLEAGSLVGRQLVARDRRPTAVFCSNDEMAIGLMRTLALAGIKVPQDISVAGFDDIEFAAMANPALTTVRQPRRELGRTGAAVLLDLMRGRSSPSRIRLETELVERASTGPVR